jgi:hypothetical protein
MSEERKGSGGQEKRINRDEVTLSSCYLSAYWRGFHTPDFQVKMFSLLFIP